MYISHFRLFRYLKRIRFVALPVNGLVPKVERESTYAGYYADLLERDCLFFVDLK